MSFGHHPMLAFPDAPGSGIVSTSPFAYGRVCPEPFENPTEGGYSSLRPGAEFDSLEHVPTLTGEDADVSRYPAREGFEDLVMMLADPSLTLGWTAVTFPRALRVVLAEEPREAARHRALALQRRPALRPVERSTPPRHGARRRQ